MKVFSRKNSIFGRRIAPSYEFKFVRKKTNTKPFNGDIYSTHQFNPLKKFKSISEVINGNYKSAFQYALAESNYITLGDTINYQSMSNSIPIDYYIEASKNEFNIIKSIAHQRLSSHYINSIILNNDKSDQLINSAMSNAKLSIQYYPFNLLAYITLGTISLITGDYSHVIKCVKSFKCFNKWDKLYYYINFIHHKKYIEYDSHITNINLHAEILSLEAKSLLALNNPDKAFNSALKLYNLLSLKPTNYTHYNNSQNQYYSNNNQHLSSDYRLMYLRVESLIIASCSISEIEEQIFSSIKLSENISMDEVKMMDRTQVESEIVSFLENNIDIVEESTTVWKHDKTKKRIELIINELKNIDCNILKPQILSWNSVLLYASNRLTEAGIYAIKALLLDIKSSANKETLFVDRKNGINIVDVVALVFKEKGHPNWKIFAFLSNLLG